MVDELRNPSLTSKIASDPKFFYKFAKRSSKTKTNIGPLLTNDNTLVLVDYLAGLQEEHNAKVELSTTNYA